MEATAKDKPCEQRQNTPTDDENKNMEEIATGTAEVVGDGVIEPDSVCGDSIDCEDQKPGVIAPTLEKDDLISSAAAADGSGDRPGDRSVSQTNEKANPSDESPESGEPPVGSCSPPKVADKESKTVQDSSLDGGGNCQTTTDTVTSVRHTEAQSSPDEDPNGKSDSGNEDQIKTCQTSDTSPSDEPESSTSKSSCVSSDKNLETKNNLSSDVVCSKRERLPSDEPESSTSTCITAGKTLEISSPGGPGKITGEDSVSSSDRDFVGCGQSVTSPSIDEPTDMLAAPDSSVPSDETPMEVDDPSQRCIVDTTDRPTESSDSSSERVTQSHSPEVGVSSVSIMSDNDCNTTTSDSQTARTTKDEESDQISENVVTDSCTGVESEPNSQEVSVSQSDTHRTESNRDMEISDSHVSQSVTVEKSEPMDDSVVTGTNDFESASKSEITNSDNNDTNSADTTGITESVVGQSGHSVSNSPNLSSKMSESTNSSNPITPSESSDAILESCASTSNGVVTQSNSEQSKAIDSNSEEKCENENPVVSDSQVDKSVTPNTETYNKTETVTSNTDVASEESETVHSNTEAGKKDSEPSTSDTKSLTSKTKSVDEPSESIDSNSVAVKGQMESVHSKADAQVPSEQPELVSTEPQGASAQSGTVSAEMEVGLEESQSQETKTRETGTLDTDPINDQSESEASKLETANEEPKPVTSNRKRSISQSESTNSDTVANEGAECTPSVSDEVCKQPRLSVTNTEELIKDSMSKVDTNVLTECADSNTEDTEETSNIVASDAEINTKKSDPSCSNIEADIKQSTLAAKDKLVDEHTESTKQGSLVSLDNSESVPTSAVGQSEELTALTEITHPESNTPLELGENSNQTDSSSSAKSVEKDQIGKNIDESLPCSIKNVESDLSSKSDKQNGDSEPMEVDTQVPEILVTKEIEDQKVKSSVNDEACLSDADVPDSDVEMTETVWQTRKRNLESKQLYTSDIDMNESSDSYTFPIPFVSSSKTLDKREAESATPSSDIDNPDTLDWVEPATPQSEETSMDTPGPFTPASAIAAPDTPVSEIQYIDTPGPFTPVSEISNDASNQAPLSAPTPAKRACIDNSSRDAVYEEYEHPSFPAENLFEYQWPPESSGEYYLLQEQISEYLAVKSFKRKYPELQRRSVDKKEKDFLRERGVVSETLCDLGLTALRSEEVYDLMHKDYPDKYQEYAAVLHEKEKQTIKDKHKDYGVAKFEKSKMTEYLKKAMKSASEWNSQFQRERREERRAYFDLQTFAVHFPENRYKKLAPEATEVSPFPVSLIPGQFQDFFKGYTSDELKYFPLNTALYDPPKKVSESDPKITDAESEEEQASAEGKESSDSEEESDEESSSDSDSSSQQEAASPIPSPAPTPSHKPKSSSDGSGRRRGRPPLLENQCRVCKCTVGKSKAKNAVPQVVVTCSECGAGGHANCLELTPEMVKVIKTYPWQCMECKTCVECMDPYDEDKMMFCDLCDRGYHTFCVGVKSIPTGRWECKSCNALDKDAETTKETSVKDTPAKENIVKDTPVKDTPVKDTPVKDTPAKETHVKDAPVKDTPIKTKTTDTPKSKSKSSKR